MKAELVPENGDPPIPIRRDITVVGRKPYCDVRIEHPTLSKRHCVLVRTAGLLILRDLATTNGTKVKGQRIRWAALLPGDRVSLGGYKVRVYLGPDDAPSPSENYAKRQRAVTGFAAPTPPVVDAVRPSSSTSNGAHAATKKATPPPPVPAARADDPIELVDADLIDEPVEKDARKPSKKDESFFIELE